MTAARFLQARLIRLCPLYVLAFLLAVGPVIRRVISGTAPLISTTVDLTTNLYFLPSPASDMLFPLNLPAWSLFFELLINLVFALTVKRLNNKVLATVVAAAGALLLLAALSRMIGFGLRAGLMDAGFDWESFGAGILRVTYSLFAGVLIYRLFRRHRLSRTCGWSTCWRPGGQSVFNIPTSF